MNGWKKTMKKLLMTLAVSSVFSGALLAATSQASGRSNDYTVGPQDVLNIVVFDEPTLSGKFRIDSDGSIAYPLLNRVVVGRLSVRAIETKIREELIKQQFVLRPQVTVDVAEFRSRSVYIIGEVRTTGKYTLNGDMSLLEALAQAGGTNAGASNDISIIRPRESVEGPVSPDRAQNAEIVAVKLSDLQSGRLSQIALQDGDTIWVPPAQKFYITGQVRSPGAFILERGMTVQQALAVAGGVSEQGSDRRISIDRFINGKKKTIKGVKLTDLVEPNDTIKVDRRIL